MKKRNRSFLKMGGIVLVLLVALSVLAAMAAASVAPIPPRITDKAAAATVPAELPATPCTNDGAGTVTCEFWATTGTLNLPGGTSVPIWGYTDTNPASGGTAQLPGPTIIANEGDTVNVTLHNDLAEDTSILFTGQDMAPDLSGVLPGDTTTYSFTASYPGTFLYEAGLLSGAQHQVPMGLYGALVVRPTADPGWAYDDLSTAFDSEALLILSEIDPALHTDPTGFDLRYYEPAYTLINGQAHPDGDELAVTAGSRVLLRYINAGLLQHSMGALGVTQEVIAADGGLFPYSYTIASETIGPGVTTDRIVTIPTSAGIDGVTRYALYDTSMQMFNNGAEGFGGMLTFLTIAETGPPPAAEELLYFSVAGYGDTNPIPGVASPYDDADVYFWDGVLAAFSRELAGLDLGLVSHADIDGLALDGGVYYISFNRNLGTSVPGLGWVQDEDIVTYNPENGLWELFTSGVDMCTSLNTTDSHDIDAFDIVNGVVYFSTFGDVEVSGVAAPYDAADIYSWDGATCSRVVDVYVTNTDKILPASANIDGLTYVDEDTFYVSFNISTTNVPGLGIVEDEDVLLYDAGVWSMYFDGTAQNLTGGGQDLDAIDVAAVTPPPPPPPPPAAGPTTNAIALAPNPADGTLDVLLTATISSDVPITGAEYFIGATGTDGGGIAMSAGDGAFDEMIEDVQATIAAADLALLGTGDHTLYVHGTNGVWGAFNFAALHLDKDGPLTSAVTLAPNPSDGTQDVTVNATGDDTATGNSDITAAEYFVDATGADGTGTPMTVNVTAPVASLSGTIDGTLYAEGAHTVSVHSMDSFGHWGAFNTATLAIDKTGPTTSNVIANPNPNNGSTPYSPTVFAVRVDATLTDDPSGTPGVNSTIQQAEGFISTVGADGSGFPLTPADGLFDAASEDAYAYIPLSTISALGVGTHQIYVHAQDASGNWGGTAVVDMVIETDSPTVSNVAASPNPSAGAAAVTLTADAADASSNIGLAEWFLGPDPGNGNGIAMAAADGSFDSPNEALTADIDITGWAIDTYTLNVRAMDAAGNWSLVASTVLDVSETPPPPANELLYFSTAGTGDPVPDVAPPYDDADVYLWNKMLAAFSRDLDTSALGLVSHADIDGFALDGGVYYISFNRNIGTFVPGVGWVQDEDIVTYNPENGQWELFINGADMCNSLNTTDSHDIDAFDVVNGVVYFSTFGNVEVTDVAPPYDSADIYSWDLDTCSRVVDMYISNQEKILPASANIDALTFVDVNTFYVSFNISTTNVPGLGNVEDEDVLLYDAGVWSIYFDGTAQNLTTDNLDLDAIDVQFTN